MGTPRHAELARLRHPQPTCLAKSKIVKNHLVMRCLYLSEGIQLRMEIRIHVPILSGLGMRLPVIGSDSKQSILSDDQRDMRPVSIDSRCDMLSQFNPVFH